MTSWIPRLDLPLLDDGFPLPVDRPFTLREAVAAGVPVHHLRTLVQRQFLRRVLRGVYVAAQVVDSRMVRAEALALVVPHTAVVSDWSACWFWTGVDAPGDNLREPPLTVFHRHPHTRLGNSVSKGGARRFLPSDVTRIGGINVTTPIRTAWDLGRLVHRDRALGGMDALCRHGTFHTDELVDGVRRFKGQRGVVQLRALAPLVDPRAESPGESALRLRWLDLPSLPPPTPQVSVGIGGVEIYRIDLGVEELRFGCEYDGEEFHRDERVDRSRRADLRDRFGWDVEGVRKANVFGAQRDVEERLHLGVERARARLRNPTYLT